MNEGINEPDCCYFHSFFRGVPFTLVSTIILGLDVISSLSLNS